MRIRTEMFLLLEVLCGGTAIVCLICLLNPSPFNAAAAVFMVMLLAAAALLVPTRK